MTHSLRIHEAAEIEINEAADFYDIESAGLGNAFLDEVQKAIITIAEHPNIGSEFRTVRSLRLERFPFSVIYSVKPDEIRFLAFAHHKRRPFYWRKRLK